MYRKTIYVPWPVALAFVLVWLLLMALLSGRLWRSPADVGEFATITHEQYSFSIVYPTKWRAETYGEAGYRGDHELKLQVFYDLFGPFWINVTQKDANYPPTLDNAVMWGIRRFDEVNRDRATRYEAGPLRAETVDGQPALRRRFTSQKYTVEDVYIARANDMITISLTSEVGTFEDVLDEFNQIVASFRSIE